ncbi:hypothetical protein GRJ2_001647400 [Grus japonensis]|uniref:Uncharacterized protein n=1 Tax=Grus japonensis TaxID=30415 RepID=A0ABC9X2M6_GRUJA
MPVYTNSSLVLREKRWSKRRNTFLATRWESRLREGCWTVTGCSTIWMRGLTALELKLGNAFGKTEDVLDEGSVVPLAWQP